MIHELGRPFSTLDLEGALTVNDPEYFRTLLFTGIGPAKAFGYELMLAHRLHVDV